MSAFKKPILLIGILAAAWFGLQWKVNNDTRKALDKLPPYMDVDFTKASLKINGELSVQDLRIGSNMVATQITIDELSWKYGNIFETISADYTFQPEELPASIQINFKNLRLPIAELANIFPVPAMGGSTVGLINTAACGNVEQIGIKELVAMGYQDFVLSMGLQFENKDIENLMELKLDANVESMGLAEILVRLDKRMSTKVNFIGNPLNVLESLELFTEDKGFNILKIQFCAGKSGLNTSEYQKAHVEAVAALFASADMQPSSEFIDAYTKYIRSGAQLEVSVRPQPNAQMSDLMFYEVGAIQNMLGLQVSVDGAELDIPGLFDRWDLNKFSQLASTNSAEHTGGFEELFSQQEENTVSAAEAAERYIPKSQRKKNVAKEPVYKITPISDAGKYIGSDITAVRTNGKSYTGVLSKVQENKIWVSVSQSGGEAVIPLSLIDIAEFHVARD